ncbi:exodeoxyribonuclease VII small subunit [Massiliimalia massiliensis]|uniref:exodeoxyribonuclease VII small subunit n=1 Tax=Massiliimalia massiliensis TaxID=1852384 RepID=UPI00098740F4|nr:exodeoxyribonuclease VII small subunit [Massiliimalia massiliensis]MBS1473703.1 exodeoxyribonuclease VII small subunit [Massiliimalia sp.]
MARTKKLPSFEETVQELEQIIARLEQGELNLDESLTLYEQGIALTRQCSQQLESAQLKLEELKAGKPDEAI